MERVPEGAYLCYKQTVSRKLQKPLSLPVIGTTQVLIHDWKFGVTCVSLKNMGRFNVAGKKVHHDENL